MRAWTPVTMVVVCLLGCSTRRPEGTSEATGVSTEALFTNETTKLTASDGADGDAFGTAIAVSGNTLVVGASGVGATDAGAAYVFVRSGSTWTQQAKLTVAGTGNFGDAVAISGDTIVVGAPFTAAYAGAAYVFVRSGTTWTQQAQLTTTGMASSYGTSVAIVGNTAIVGAPGSMGDVGQAYVFTRTGVVWTNAAKLNPPSPYPGMKFGSSVAFDGTTVAVGSPNDNVAGSVAGSVDLFKESCTFVGSWVSDGHVSDPAPSFKGYFGTALAIENDTLVVTEPGDSFVTMRGRAFVFKRTTTPMSPPLCPTDAWGGAVTLTASDAADNDQFGSSVALSGTRLAIGAYGWSSYRGKGYYRTRASTSVTTFAEKSTLLAKDGDLDVLGSAAAFGSDFTALGARNAKSPLATTPGAVYIFATDLAPDGASCTAPGDCSSGFCVSSICCNTACGTGTCSTGSCVLPDAGADTATDAKTDSTVDSGADTFVAVDTGADTKTADSSSVDGSTADTATVDTATADTATVDTATADTAVDTATADTADTSTEDSATPDTAVEDTSTVEDTGVVEDTAVEDASAADGSTDDGSVDAESPDATTEASTGCGCRVVESKSSSTSALLSFAIGAILLARRRRR